MALEATHIRFALDIKDKFGVQDINKYLSGSIYPDSRYPTGIDRTLTHDDRQMTPAFWLDDDFRKGWAAHLVYDKIQFAVHTNLFADILMETNPQITKEQDWIIRSALKIVQDLSDIQAFDIKSHLSALDYIENPNGEDVRVVRDYNTLCKQIYSKAPDVTIADLREMWVAWGVSNQHAQAMEQWAQRIQSDPDLYDRVCNTYARTLELSDNYFNQYCV